MALPDTQVLCEIFSHFAGAPGSKIEIARRSLIYVFLVFPGRGGLAGTAIPDSSNDRAQRGID